ncbi:MAG: bifunctional 2-polyprenyl-6-hydroxyphenol methylase/3-demethylubiquinol 3-O-methyltransferase UbiG [Alphaproteobacteria bacterium]|nr:bifunctional 2-polyprenyl-6-hydroxyphenol methylase/3-demethylubiquinol 3-O-methyltransferase UbiG [Alphaproteobacteria bacterium]
MSASTIDESEIARFSAMAEAWWDPAGKFKPLHQINPVRLAYIREHVIEHFGLDGAVREPLAGLRMLDIGCGGGLLCEPMARLGAEVVGVDPGHENIAIARAHARDMELDIDYRATDAETLAAAGEQFDVVLNMEVVEHVADVSFYLKSCADLVKPGGLMFVATINRTARAYALAIIGAEYVLGWLPKGTHSYDRFVTPDEVGSVLGRNGMRVRGKCGVSYMPLKDAWRKSRDLGVNYMLVAEKNRPA